MNGDKPTSAEAKKPLCRPRLHVVFVVAGAMVATALVFSVYTVRKWDERARNLARINTELKQQNAKLRSDINDLQSYAEELQDFAGDFLDAGMEIYQQDDFHLAAVITALAGGEDFNDFRKFLKVAGRIRREAERNNLDPLMILAVIRVESNFQSDAVSPVGAIGLMQLMPHTGFWLADRHGLPPTDKRTLTLDEVNITLGASYLSYLRKRYSSWQKALTAYNWGPGRFNRILSEDDPAPDGLYRYSAKVMRTYWWIKRIWQQNAAGAEVFAKSDT